MDIQATAGKRNQRPRTRRPGGEVRRPMREAATPGEMDGPAPNSSVWILAFSDAPGGKARGQVTDKDRWPADVKAGIARHTQFRSTPMSKRPRASKSTPCRSSGSGAL